MTAQPLRRSLRLQRQDRLTALPVELQRCIGKRLPTGRDLASFRLSGRPLRDAVPLLAGFDPVLMLPFHPDGTVSFYRPTDGATFQRNLPALRRKVLCGSSRGWLALADVAGDVTLLNPFTGATAHLPPANNRLGEACFRRVSMDLDARRCNFKERALSLGEMREALFREIVLSSQPDSGDCVAVALLARSWSVAVCRVGVDAEWKLLDADLTCRVRSVVHCRGSKFLAIGYNGEIAICDVGGATPRATRMQRQPLYPPRHIWRHSYIQVGGKLHLVGTIYQNSANRSRVYRCDVFARKTRWSRVKDVGDVTLFVSNGFIMGHAGATLAGLCKNSVYFAEPLAGFKAGPNHVEVNNIANGKSKLLAYREKVRGSSEALCWIQPKPNPWTPQGGGADH